MSVNVTNAATRRRLTERTPHMDIQRVAEIQVVLEGIRLPATRDELIAYARRYDAVAAEQLARLPERSYDSIDSAAEELLSVQPSPRQVIQMQKQQDRRAGRSAPSAG